jgi:KDO2-lipid IV(A) lauroyltransferase
MDVVEPTMVVSGEEKAPAGDDLERRPTLVQRLEYLALRGAETIARISPVWLVSGVGSVLAGMVGPWLRQNRRALENLAVAFPEKSERERRAIARAMWANMGRIFAETLVIDRIVAQDGLIEIADRAHWQARFSTPGPSIGCTLHMGNWELAIWPLKTFGRAPTGVYKPLDNPLVDRWLVERRRALYPGGLLGKGEDDAKAGQRTARQLIDMARKGGCIGFVADHFDRRGEPIAFMGRRARFTTAPAMIARHVGARFWVGCCRRIGASGCFQMELREIEVPRTGDKAADARLLTTQMFAVFEEWIRANPEQWMWWNTRWVKDDGTTFGKRDRQ